MIYILTSVSDTQGLLGSGQNWSNWQQNGVIVQLMDIFLFSSEWLKEALRILQADSKCC